MEDGGGRFPIHMISWFHRSGFINNQAQHQPTPPQAHETKKITENVFDLWNMSSRCQEAVFINTIFLSAKNVF